MNKNKPQKTLQFALLFIIAIGIVLFANAWLFRSLDAITYLFTLTVQMVISSSLLSFALCAFYYENKLAKQSKITKDIINNFENYLEFNRASSEEGRQILEKMQQEVGRLAEQLGNPDQDSSNKLLN